MIVPGEGRYLCEFDFSSFHAVTLGREAQSVSYVRLAKCDIHSFLTSHLIKQPIDSNLPIEELKERLAWIKKNYKGIRDTKAKPSLLGIGFGLGATKLHHMNRDSIENVAEAKKLLDLIKALFPEIFKWQNFIREKAHKQTYLVSAWGGTRNFFDVYQFKKDNFGKWGMKPGLDSEKAIAFLPATSAFGMMRSKMQQLEAMGANQRFKLVNTIHDSLVYECKIKDLDYCVDIVSKVLTSPCKTLVDPIVCPEGLVVDIEVKYGLNWQDCEVYVKK